jgi:hypothetical protein
VQHFYVQPFIPYSKAYAYTDENVLNNGFSPNSIDLFTPSQQLLINFHAVNALFGELECGEENGVDDAGAGHGYTQP